MLEFLKNLDRRWIFLLMALSVIIPIIVIGITGQELPEYPTPLARAVFDQIEKLEPGDRVLLAFDYDPASQGELQPMATSFVRHCAEKQLKLYFLALWPVGPQMIDETITNVIINEYNTRPDVVGTEKEYVYGEDYVNLGFKSGNEGVIKVIVSNLRELYTTDATGTSVDKIPMMQSIQNVRQMHLQINVSAGYPGTKEWVQYAATAFPDDIVIVAGCTGVQAPLLYPYIPQQLKGLLGAIKGAAEYEQLVNEKYNPEEPADISSLVYADWQSRYGRYTEGIRRMGPQLVAHLLIILLIIVANIIYFADRRQERRG